MSDSTCDVCGAELEDGLCPDCGERAPVESLPREFGENPFVTGLVAATVTGLLLLIARAWIATL